MSAKSSDVEPIAIGSNLSIVLPLFIKYRHFSLVEPSGRNHHPTATILSKYLKGILRWTIAISILSATSQVSATTDGYEASQLRLTPISGNENFTFLHNGSFLQIDAGREWPFNSKREISFRFRTKSPHGLLIYQTFDHNKLQEEDNTDLNSQQPPPPQPPPPQVPPIRATPIIDKIVSSQDKQPVDVETALAVDQAGAKQRTDDDNRPDRYSPAIGTIKRRRQARSNGDSKDNFKIGHFARADEPTGTGSPLDRLSSGAITATASERLVNSLFSSSPMAAINGNHPARLSALIQSASHEKMSQLPGSSARDAATLSPSPSSSSASSSSLPSSSSSSPSSSSSSSYPSSSSAASSRGRFRTPDVSGENRLGNFNLRSASEDRSTVLSSTTISSFSASLYELYLKLENGRLKIMYEFGSRLNQTYCGKGLNDDRWHRIDLRVDPELNQMTLILDQVITVEIVLSQVQHEEEAGRRSELVFTNSVLYLGGLNNNASIVRNVRQRLYLAQFIGCMGQILLKTDQQTESTLQPAYIDRAVLVRRGCSNLCHTNNYCLHKSTCINHYTHTKCDCFTTNYEDTYCWNDKLTTLTMLGYSNLVYRIYDWRDRHHSGINRLSLHFKTLALNSILFFAYGDLTQPSARNLVNLPQQSGTNVANTMFTFQGLPSAQLNISSLPTIHRPLGHPVQGNNNYLAVSLSNGSLVAEVNFGDQPVLLSSFLHEKINNETGQEPSRPLSLSDGEWHNVTFTHNNKLISLTLDNHSISYTILGKNNHLYFDPSIYVGGVPNFLLNETKALVKPFNLRHKFVGCLKSVYFNQHNLLLALKQNSSMVDYRDLVGKPQIDVCKAIEPSSLPLTLRSGKSYLTFQLSPSGLQHTSSPSYSTTTSRFKSLVTEGTQTGRESKPSINRNETLDSHPQASSSPVVVQTRKITVIEFEYKTSLQMHFLAGGHLRDLNYHDLGGFWTLHSREDCQFYFTTSSGLTFDPEQVLKLSATNTSCSPGVWYRISISIASGDRKVNITRTQMSPDEDNVTSSSSSSFVEDLQQQQQQHGSYTLESSIELLHQVQLGGDLAKFGESSSIPFAGCMRRIRINGHSFDPRDFVTPLITPLQVLNPNPLPTGQQNNLTTMVPLLQQAHQQEVILSKMSQGYVTIDSCQLVNPCSTLNPCKNGAQCKINELGEPDCDCARTGYVGKRCHFSIYKQSCHDLFLSGQRKSSYYLIDLDRNGPLKPIRVRCNMDELLVGHHHQIETSLSHNLPAEYLIRRSPTSDLVMDITYLAFHHMYTYDGFYLHDEDDKGLRANQDRMLQALIGQSLFCRQYFRYECRSAPLYLGNKTWMEVPYPRRHRLVSLDGGQEGRCSCASSDKRCLNPTRSCNCDANEPIWSDDFYELTGQDQVGLTRIVLLKNDAGDQDSADHEPSNRNSQESSQSRFTLSDLKCYGAKQHESQHEITFKTSDAYIEVPGWRRGDISFSFRTASSPPAIVLYQLATSRNHGYFRLTLISDLRLMFEFIVNRRPRKLFLTSSHKLNNGEWQQVFIEYDAVNLRLTVNDESVMVDLDLNDHLGTFEGPLFIGGAPSKYLVGDQSKRNGFTGCFRGLIIDGRSIDLSSYLSPQMPTVISGCQPSCTKNLCQNGGNCIEYWGSYECECSNPIAHSGSNCEINLNTNSITFLTPESYYVQHSNESLTYPIYLTKSILLNIRTYQETALILYASDRLGNFIQLHKNDSTLVLTFNSNTTIVTVQVPIDNELGPNSLAGPVVVGPPPPPPVVVTSPIGQPWPHDLALSNHSVSIHHHQPSQANGTSNKQSLLSLVAKLHIPILSRPIRVSNMSGSGQPIQVKIERHRLRITFYVNNNFVVVEKPMIFLTNYSQNPWLNPEQELIRPARPKLQQAKLQSRLFLANIDEHFTTRLPGFTGCIQGFSMNNQLFDFNRAHLTGELRGDYKIGCKMHCDSFPCKNQGTCIENWIEDRIQCKCDSTSYVGRLCDEDIAAIFNGQTSYFVYHLNKRLSDQPTTNKSPSSEPTTVTNQTSGQLLMASEALNSNNISSSQSASSSSYSSRVDDNNIMNFLEISLAFSSESNQSLNEPDNSVQVLILITRANSSKHFLMGLTSDGSLLIQEDYGHSMCK